LLNEIIKEKLNVWKLSILVNQSVNLVYFAIMKISRIVSYTAFILLICFASCGGSGKKATYKIEKASFQLEAPLFSGANTGQAEHKIDLAVLKKELGLDDADVKSAKLVKAVIYFQDSALTDVANSLVLSLAGDKVNMAQIAVANPLETDKKEVVLKGSSEAEIAEFFNQAMMYIILDVDVKADSETSLKLLADLEFELEF